MKLFFYPKSTIKFQDGTKIDMSFVDMCKFVSGLLDSGDYVIAPDAKNKVVK